MVLRVASLLAEATAPYAAGEYRVCPPEETIARYRVVAKALGITRIANVTGLDVIGLPVVMVVRPASRSLSVSQGKGLTPDAAVASGLMESIEAFHAENIVGPLLWGSYADLSATRSLVRTDLLPRLTTSLYSPYTPILWVEGSDLLVDESVWVPLEVVTLDFSHPAPPGFGCFTMTSNGLASGNNALEAVLHGLCEVIERDARYFWSCLPAPVQEGTRIDLATIEDPWSAAIIQRLRNSGVALAVWDMTSDIRVAVFRCSIVNEEPAEIGFSWPCVGMGCHPDRSFALRRALLEAVQSRLTYIAGSRDDIDANEYKPRFTHPAASDEILTCNGTRPFTEVPDTEARRLDELLLWTLGQLKRLGLESVVVVDLSKPEFGIPVVRVVVPGLEGLRDGYPAGAEFVPLRRPGLQDGFR